MNGVEIDQASSDLNQLDLPAEPQLYDLITFSAGEKVFAVNAECVEATAQSRTPAILPLVPAPVLGVVCVRGRMLTVIDPISLINAEAFNWPKSLPQVIALQGDEQLGLAAEEYRGPITIATSDIRLCAGSITDDNDGAILGIARHGGAEITVLNQDHLLAAITRKRERRRRRF